MSGTNGTSVQFSDEAMAEFERICARYPVRRSALIPTLRLAQEEFGYLPPAAIRYVAELMDLSPMDVLSVTSFYEMLHTEPVGERHIWVCHNLTCALCGAEDIIRHIEGRLGIRVGQVTKDGRFSLGRAECLGACDRGPMLWSNDAFYVDLTPEKVDALIGEWKKETKEGGSGPPAGVAAGESSAENAGEPSPSDEVGAEEES